MDYFVQTRCTYPFPSLIQLLPSLILTKNLLKAFSPSAGNQLHVSQLKDGGREIEREGEKVGAI